ncbi:hypothetical protein ACJJIL_08240 [Microbulbifer sp. EKSA005]
MHEVMVGEQRGEIDITLSRNYLAFTAGDMVLFQGGGAAVLIE